MTTQGVTIATWNVNGIRARLPRVLEWLRTHPVDVLCMQETKVQDAQFPSQGFEELGYRVTVHGQKSFNGVALLTKESVDDVVRGMEGDAQARLVGATVGGIRVFSVYVPNGQAVGSEKYRYKLEWMASLRDLMQREVAMHGEVVVCGDFNVAPEPRDTYDPSVWEGGILCSEAEREALSAVRGVGLHDVYRAVHPDGEGFTWWDYRAGAFARGWGIRLDHVYVTSSLLGRVGEVWVDVEARRGEGASDHAPVVCQ